MCLWFVVLLLFCLVQFGPNEHATLADLLEVVSSNREYLGRVVTVVVEHTSSHTESLRQPIASFSSFSDRFVKYTLTTPEAEPAVEPWLHSSTYTPIWAGKKRNHLTTES